MRIESIEIRNFRSYVGLNTFQINSGLTLIIGANGEGKTNLYEAMEWLFENNMNYDSKRIISKKTIVTLSPGEEDEMMVALDFVHNDTKYRVEKSLKFNKNDDGDIKLSQIRFMGFKEDFNGRVPTDGARLLDNCFNASIRHFSLMAGEESLKILNQDTTLKYLIHTFSTIRHADKFTEFTKEATAMAQRASQNAISKNTKNKKDYDKLTREIEDLTSQLRDKQRELRNAQEQVCNYANQIEAIVNSSEASEEMRDLQTRLDNLQNEKTLCRSRIHENYTVGLLDDMMVLGGIMPILKEYSDKIAYAELQRRIEEHEYLIKEGERRALKKVKLELENGSAPLPVYAPDEKFMREMLNDHICKVCGTPAPEGSAPYNYIQNKLNAYLESLEKQEDELDTCFINSYIPNLAKQETILNNEKEDIAKIFDELQDLIEYNEERKKQLRKIEENIAQVEEDQRKLQARVPGVTKEVLLNNFMNLTNWNKDKSNYELKIVNLQHMIERLETDINCKREKLSKLAVNTPAAIYSKIAEAFEYIQDAFKSALKRNKTEFILELERVANKYLAKLNVEDFKGTIHIYADVAGAMRISLIDIDKAPIDPNKALETTMYMSVLFAISELTEIKKDDEYPLFFDAPTSSFAVGKEKDFFRIIDKLDKQIIIVTKSFLKEVGPNEYILDESMLDELDIKGTIYRIEKKKPFDDKNQATIQTIIKRVR